MHSTLEEIMFRSIGSLYFTLIAINIRAWMNNYVFIYKLSQMSVPISKASHVELVNGSLTNSNVKSVDITISYLFSWIY